MEEKFIRFWAECRRKAEEAGVRMRPVADDAALTAAHRSLSGSRVSDGFYQLADRRLLHLSLEALAVDSRFTGLFSDEEADNALQRLMDAGFYGL